MGVRHSICMSDDPTPPRVTSSPDDELLRRARSGDREALDALFDREVPRLRRWASGRLPRWARDIADTSDLVQETFLETFKRLDAFEHRGEGALHAYLRQALINRVRNQLRRMATRPQRASLESGWPDDGLSPLETTMGREKLDRYEAALACLDTNERDAVVSRIEFGMTYAEVAAALGKPSPDAARMAVVRALERLTEVMTRQRLERAERSTPPNP